MPGRLAVRPYLDWFRSFDSIFQVVSDSDDCIIGCEYGGRKIV